MICVVAKVIFENVVGQLAAQGIYDWWTKKTEAKGDLTVGKSAGSETLAQQTKEQAAK